MKARMTSVSRGLDQKDFRRTLGQFATGVTVVTTRTRDGRPVGITVNSFTSVSLTPPLVLWCLARQSSNRAIFEEATHFAVSILAANQHSLSHRFAAPVADKFDGVSLEEGKERVPLLKGVIAQLICRKVRQYDGGDHVIFLGEVEEYHRSEGKPLIFHSGRYHVMTQHPDLPE